jgi:hypothetical protein
VFAPSNPHLDPLDIMSVNRYNPYHANSAADRGAAAQYPAQASSTVPATQRHFDPAVWQWVPDAPEDLKGPYRVLMSGLPTENVAKKEIIVSDLDGTRLFNPLRSSARDGRM